jgi:hypothetical protein
MISKDEATRIRCVMVMDYRWSELTKDLPIVALAQVGPLDVDNWERSDADAVYEWLKEETDKLPIVLKVYLKAIELKDLRMKKAGEG